MHEHKCPNVRASSDVARLNAETVDGGKWTFIDDYLSDFFFLVRSGRFLLLLFRIRVLVILFAEHDCDLFVLSDKSESEAD